MKEEPLAEPSTGQTDDLEQPVIKKKKKKRKKDQERKHDEGTEPAGVSPGPIMPAVFPTLATAQPVATASQAWQ